MDKSRLHILLNKYQDNACTEDELTELENWYHSLNSGKNTIDNTDAFADEMLLQFRTRLAVLTPVLPFYRRKIFRIAAAAAVVILIATTALLVFQMREGSKSVISSQLPGDITAPVGSKAYITLSDGRKIYLDSLQNGTVATDAGITINKQGDKIIYEASQLTADVLRLNTLTVPKGSKPFKLLLADGSEMWLDAATTVTYPNAFVGKERRVEIITGQAYFEIAHNSSMPFIAKKGNAEVQVLGTHFNVSAFDDEDLKVTLLEGSVRISPAGGGDLSDANNNKRLGAVLKPGQQAVLIQHSTFNIQNNIDLDEVMAWKNGNFQFEGADINTVMKQLARWYDVEVEIKGNIPEHFGGIISRDVSVSQVFHMLQLTGEVNYKIEGRKIIVTP